MNPNDSENLDAWDARRARVKAASGNGNGMGEPLGVAVRRLTPSPPVIGAEDLLPKPLTSDHTGSGCHGSGGQDLRTTVERNLPLTPVTSDTGGARNSTASRMGGSYPHSGASLCVTEYQDRFGKYAPVIQRWEEVLGRPAPNPTAPTGKNGEPRLSPAFVEWMMGLSAGWVDECDLTRAQKIKILGNGVVPQQAASALQDMKQSLEPNLGTTNKG